MNKAKQSGFTLIELISVIVILGVLSAFALPRFANLNEQATIAVLEGISAALKAGLQQFNSQKFINPDASTIDLGGGPLTLDNGYPNGRANSIRRLISSDSIPETFTRNATTIKCQSELCILGGRRPNQLSIPGFTSGTAAVVWPKGYLLANCYVYFANKENGEPPLIGLISNGC